MADREALEALFRKHGSTDFTWIDPRDIVVAHWVRMKCRFGCDGYGKIPSCPPNVPSVDECREFFWEYSTAAVFHFQKRVDSPEDRHAWSRSVNRGLSALEREVFLSGHERAFLLFMDSCTLCQDCVGTKEECRNPQAARPSPEAMAIDVFSTVRKYGLPIEVLSDYTQPMNRYAFLLIE
jgi:predicted metal-binding protein